VIKRDEQTSFSLYHRHRFPAEIIAEAAWLYFRFPLSFRMIEDMLAFRGIIVTHETVREWAEKFVRRYASSIRRRTPRLGEKWPGRMCDIHQRRETHWVFLTKSSAIKVEQIWLVHRL